MTHIVHCWHVHTVFFSFHFALDAWHVRTVFFSFHVCSGCELCFTFFSGNTFNVTLFLTFMFKVGGLGDVVTGLSKALQRKGHLVEVIVPKYDCLQYESIRDLKVIGVYGGALFISMITL